MKMYLRSLFAGLILFGALGAVAYAQGLPPAPRADHDSSSRASRRGESGGALEPYLITLLLPVGGIIMAGAGLAMDRRLRAAGHG